MDVFICLCEERSNLNCLYLGNVRCSQTFRDFFTVILLPAMHLENRDFRLLHKRGSQWQT